PPPRGEGRKTPKNVPAPKRERRKDMNRTRFTRRLLLALALLVGPAAAARADEPAEKLPPGAKLVRIEAAPASITLTNPFDYRQFLLTGVLESGDKLDVTRLAKLEQPAAQAKVSPRGLVRPAADGTGQLKFTLEGKSVVVPLTVSGQK